MKLPAWVVPAAIAACTAIGVAGARWMSVPSVVRDFQAGPPAGARTTVFVVDGVKCVDTASRAADQVKDVPGVARFVAFASRNRVEITFDPARTNPATIQDAIEGPVYDSTAAEYLFNVYRVVEVDGVRVPRRP